MSVVQEFSPGGPAERRALIYDDDETYAEECAEALERHGFVTATRAGRTDFLRLIGNFSPDVLILDLHMPGRDGVEVLRALRDYEHKRDVLVVLVSAAHPVMLSTAADLATAYGVRLLGAFPKPLKFADLVARLRRAFHGEHKTAQN